MRSESELILNPDGSIYHLGLHRDQIATTVFTVGDPGRVALVSDRFDAVEHRVTKREFVTHTGRVGPHPVTCISTGIGTDNVDIVINELDALVNVDPATRAPRHELTSLALTRLGTAGALRPEIPVDSLVVSEAAIGLDGLGPFYAFADHGFGTAFADAFPDLGARAYDGVAEGDLLRSWCDEGAVPGVTLTTAGFYGPQGRALRLPSRMPPHTALAEWMHAGRTLANFEMETAGLYALGAALGHRVCSVSAILANRAAGTFSAVPERTVASMLDRALSQLGSGG